MSKKQMPLIEPATSHPQERELEIVGQIINHTLIICGRVLQDLNEADASPQTMRFTFLEDS